MKYIVTDSFADSAYKFGQKVARKQEGTGYTKPYKIQPESWKSGMRAIIEWALVNQAKLKKTKT